MTVIEKNDIFLEILVFVSQNSMHLITTFRNCMELFIFRQGFLDPETVRTVLHAHHVPLPDDLLRAGIAM